MKEMKLLNEITTKLKNTRRKLVVAGGNAPSVIQSVAESINEGFIEATLVGDREEILKLSEECNLSSDLWNIVDEKEPTKIAAKSVEIVRSKKADILMKGFISSADYLHAILNKQYGLLEAGGFLTHIVVMQVPRYHKLLIFSDAAILEQPDLSQKITMLKFCMNIANKIGISKPKAGIISCVEKPSFKIDSTIDASIIKKMVKRGQLEGVEVDGPLALDLAISKRCAEEKKFKSPVAGDCDILIFPNICTGNVFFKALTTLADAKLAAVIMGASVPCILTSRADTKESKFLSIALASFLSKKNRSKND